MSDKQPVIKGKAGSGDFFVLLQDAARLMVGVGSYAQYCAHMVTHHPDTTPMTEVEYFRYCQDARYPGKSGSIKRCPC